MSKKSKRIAGKSKAVADTARWPVVTEVPPPYGHGEAALFALTLFLSAALLFTVQPMFAKMVLPRLGGAQAVWNACLVFYQAALLGGYLYAHLSLKWLGPRRQAIMHLGLLALAWISLPIRITDEWLPPATTFPAPWLWLLLTIALGLPFFAVSASAPMLQAWFARTGKTAAGRDPYFLYAASNLGSMLGLASYPLLMETHLTLAGQSLSWAIGFGLLTVLIAACAARLWMAPASKPSGNVGAASPEKLVAITARRRLRWLALSLVPSSLLMGVTTYITSEIIQMPFLWVLPLEFYLLTFVLVFAPRTLLPLKWMLVVQVPLMVLAAASLLFNPAGMREMLILGSLHLVVFFVTAMVCHGQLAADRPEPARLTEFYLWVSLGGVVGGLFSALLAPLLFDRAVEYPLMLAAACMLRPMRKGASRARFLDRRDVVPIIAILLCLAGAWCLRTDMFISAKHVNDGWIMRLEIVGLAAVSAFLLARGPVVFGLAIAAVATIGAWTVQTDLQLLHAERSFFGILRVEYDSLLNTHQLLHGTTTHGLQSQYDDQRHEPQGYYHRTGPLGEIFAALKPRRPMAEVGILGLGAGGIAAYAEPGERFTFYEIDPAVERIAWNPNYFTFLTDCRGKPEVILGDARLKLEHGPKRKFDLLILDVFSSDSVPVHLMTREALQLYCSRITPHGILAFHISSRYLNLEPALGRLAVDAKPPLTARIWDDRSEEKQRTAALAGWYPSIWLVMARSLDDLGALARSAHWTAPQCDPGSAWSDDFSNIVGTLLWRSGAMHLAPKKWMTSGKAERAEAHAALANYMLSQGRTDDAIDQFRRSLEFDADNAAVHYALGAALASLGKTEEAADEYASALLIDPGNAKAHFGLGVAAGKLGKPDEAILGFRHAIELDPKYFEAYINLGHVLLDRKKFQEAQKCYRKGLTVKPDNADLHYGLGRALMQLGQVKPDALDEFRRALQLAEQAGNAALADKIMGEIRRCEAWPWEEGKK
jgi:tetratricopeptide (TPR) repeat protein